MILNWRKSILMHFSNLLKDQNQQMNQQKYLSKHIPNKGAIDNVLKTLQPAHAIFKSLTEIDSYEEIQYRIIQQHQRTRFFNRKKSNVRKFLQNIQKIYIGLKNKDNAQKNKKSQFEQDIASIHEKVSNIQPN